jgi:hypothetical protein
MPIFIDIAEEIWRRVRARSFGSRSSTATTTSIVSTRTSASASFLDGTRAFTGLLRAPYH